MNLAVEGTLPLGGLIHFAFTIMTVNTGKYCLQDSITSFFFNVYRIESIEITLKAMNRGISFAIRARIVP
jgi:hypothetical protein